MNISDQALLEISDLSYQAEHLAKGGASDRAQSAVLLQRINTMRQSGLSSDEVRSKYGQALHKATNPKQPAEYRAKFADYCAGKLSGEEFRDWLGGQQSNTWTAGLQGGFFIPFEQVEQVFEGMSQVSPILNPKVTNFLMSNDYHLGPAQYWGYDLSTLSGALLTEAQQQTAQQIPTTAGGNLNANIIFKCSFAMSDEAAQDIPDFFMPPGTVYLDESPATKVVRAASVALARRLNQSIFTGRGGANDILGVTNALGAPSVSIGTGFPNQTSGNVTAQDLTNAYFKVDRWHRGQPRCAWLFNDAGYKLIRNASDNVIRPLLDMADDRETLLGKPVYICPDLGIGQSAGVGAFLFGNLEHLIIRCSRPTLQRTTQTPLSDVTKGESLWIGRVRADARIFDPSGGNFPPIILGTVI